MSERVVSQSERASYLHALAVRRESAAAASANFWVFEDANDSGRFLEFVEAGSQDALARAIDAAVDQTAKSTEGPSRSAGGSQVVWTEIA